MNVGVAHNDKSSHLYDIRDYDIRDNKNNKTAAPSKMGSAKPGQKTGVLLTSGSVNNNIISGTSDSVNTQNAETVSDLNRIYDDGVRSSRGKTSADYLQNAQEKTVLDPTDVNSVYSAATPLQEELNGIVRGLCEMLGTEYEDTTQKSTESMENKVERKHKEGRGDYTLLSMKDHARQKVFVNDWTDIPTVLDYLDARGIAYQTEAVGPTEYGYKGFHITWTNGNGLGSELQVTMPDVWKVKLASDAIYDKWRNVKLEELTAEQAQMTLADLERSQKMWDALHLPDFGSFSTSSGESGRPIMNVSPNTDVDGFTHSPSMSSLNPSGESRNTRPVSVSTKRDSIYQSPFRIIRPSLMICFYQKQCGNRFICRTSRALRVLHRKGCDRSSVLRRTWI